MKFFSIVVSLWLTVGLALGEEVVPQKSTKEVVVEKVSRCDSFASHVDLCKKIDEARVLAHKTAPEIFELIEHRFDKKGKSLPDRRVIRREVVLIAYDREEDRFRTIVIDMPLVGNSTFQPNVRTEHSPPYEVIRIKGQTFNKMIFRVTVGERELYVYAAKHLSVPPAFRSKNVETMIEEAEPIVYLATPPYIANEEFARQGKKIALQAIGVALDDLRINQVYSKSYPGQLVADVVHQEASLNLIVSEQTDPCLFKERSRECVRLIPKRLYEEDAQVVDAVLTEFVINGLDAYRYICSEMNACGAYQFTNRKVRLKNDKVADGTYDAMRKAYPGASIDPDFRRGTQSFHNSAKAAAVLIDYELSSRGVPNWVREASVQDHQLKLLIPGAAYNGGPSQSKALAGLITAFGKLKKLEYSAFDPFPWHEFLVWMKKRGAVLKYETTGYVEKCVNNWAHFRRYEGMR